MKLLISFLFQTASSDCCSFPHEAITCTFVILTNKKKNDFESKFAVLRFTSWGKINGNKWKCLATDAL